MTKGWLMGINRLRKKGWEIAAIVLCMLIISFGVSWKEGYHMDELLSFELANARFNPWIVPTQPQGRLAKFVENEIMSDSFSETFGNLWDTVKDVLENRGSSKLLSYEADVYEEPVWISGEQFKDYITVDGQDAFQYLSVYFNVKDDNHPPLHFMMLHTVSSLFWGQIRPFMGCIINMAAVAGIMIFLMKLGRVYAGFLGMEERGRLLGLFAALLYGLSTGAMATVLLIRMYGVLSFFCVAFFYLCIQKWKNREYDQKNFRLIAVTALGFWTQYFFLFYCILLSAVTFFALLLKKRSREGLCFLRSMAAAGAVGVVIFPFSIADVLSSSRGTEALENLSQGFRGYGERLFSFGTILGERTFGSLFWILAAMAVFCGVWGSWRILKKGKTKKERKEDAVREAICMLIMPAAGYFLLASRMSPYLVDRYVMPVFPFAALGGALVVFWWLHLLEGYFGKRNGRRFSGLVLGALLILQAFRLTRYDGSYLYRGYEKQESLAKEYGEISCICVYEGVGYYENLPEFIHYERTLLITPEELEDRKDRESIENLEKAVILVKAEVSWERALEIMEKNYGFTEAEELLTDSVHGDRIFLVER